MKLRPSGARKASLLTDTAEPGFEGHGLYVQHDAHSHAKETKVTFERNRGGRPVGSRNKFSGAFLRDFLADWEVNGPAAIKTVRMRDPSTYLRVAASILPKELMVESVSSGLTPEERIEMLTVLKQQLLTVQREPILIEAKTNGFERSRQDQGTDCAP
jgi:hypothetical protein